MRRSRLAFWIQSFSFGYSRSMPSISSRSWTRSLMSMSRNRIVKVVVKGLFGVNDMNALSPHELRSRSNHRPTDTHLRLLIGTGVFASSGREFCVLALPWFMERTYTATETPPKILCSSIQILSHNRRSSSGMEIYPTAYRLI